MSADQGADEIFAEFRKSAERFVGIDTAGYGDDVAIVLVQRDENGSIRTQPITKEEFYASAGPIEPLPVPDTVAAMQELMKYAGAEFDDVTGIGQIMLQPKRQGKTAYVAMQKMLINRYAAEPGIFIPPIQRGHPTSPRKHKK